MMRIDACNAEVIHTGAEELAVALGHLAGIGLHGHDCEAPGVGIHMAAMPRINPTDMPMKDS